MKKLLVTLCFICFGIFLHADDNNDFAIVGTLIMKKHISVEDGENLIDAKVCLGIIKKDENKFICKKFIPTRALFIKRAFVDISGLDTKKYKHQYIEQIFSTVDFCNDKITKSIVINIMFTFDGAIYKIDFSRPLNYNKTFEFIFYAPKDWDQKKMMQCLKKKSKNIKKSEDKKKETVKDKTKAKK